MFPIPARPVAETDPDGYCERWVCYGTGCYSAKELTVSPERDGHDHGRGRLWIDPHAGTRPFGTHPVSTPAMIRFGAMTEDELFVTADAAQAGVRVENTSDAIRSSS